MATGKKNKLHQPPVELRRAEKMDPRRRRKARNYHARYRYDFQGYSPNLRRDSNAINRRTFPIPATPPPSPRFLALVREAILNGGVLDLVYRDRLGAKTKRRIHPKAWVGDDRLTAYCELREADRDFLVHRFADRRPVSSIKPTA